MPRKNRVGVQETLEEEIARIRSMRNRYKNLAVATALCVIVNIVMLTVVSWVYFKEPLTTKQMIGIALSLAAVFLLE